MTKPALSMQDCWAPAGRLRIDVSNDGASVRIDGNRDGLVGLARVLLWHVQHGSGPADLAALGAFEGGGTTLEVGLPE